MRKFLAALMAVFMLAAIFAVLPISATTASASDKDGSTAADADAIDLVITEVLANSQSNVLSMKSKDAFQYIEIYNRGSVAVNLFDYAIVRTPYTVSSNDPWPNKKFDGKVVLDEGPIYQYYVDNGVSAINPYNTTALGCNNSADDTLQPGEVAIIWFWNAATKDAFTAKGGTTASEKDGTFNSFRNHYKDLGAEIPADVKIFATFGVTGVGQSFELNTSKDYMYALVKDNEGENGFDIGAEVAYEATVGGNFIGNDKIVCMFEYGTGLGLYTTVENKAAIYTLASKLPQYTNAYYETDDADYYESGDVDSYKELGCIYFEEDVTPGKLLPIQWADLDPDRAPADVKGTDDNWATTAWNTYVTALVAANGGGETTDRDEEDKHQDQIDVNRNDLGNQGQNKLGEWTYFTQTDEATGETTYWRYKTEGGSKETAVEVDKEEYDRYLQKLAEQDQQSEGGLETWVVIVIIVAAVVVAGGAAVVVIFVLKKKKQVAADDVAGFVQIIDENQSEQ